jgi:hypothetical protein
MGFISRLSRWIVQAALLAAVSGAWTPVVRGASCPVPAPVLTGPVGVQAGESYALSWTNVFTDPTASNLNYYVVERALDSGFTSGLDQTTTQRSAITLTPGAPGATILYHRILVRSSCPTASAVAIVSNVVAVPVKTVCDVPPSVVDLGHHVEHPRSGRRPRRRPERSDLPHPADLGRISQRDRVGRRGRGLFVHRRTG